jgi:hypothetical protein
VGEAARVNGLFRLRREPLARLRKSKAMERLYAAQSKMSTKKTSNTPAKKTNSVETTSRNSCRTCEKKDFY